MIKSIIIEGIDRLGKNTLIEGLLNRFGYFEVVHYQKPRLLTKYSDQAYTAPQTNFFTHADLQRLALKYYQEASFTNMFRMLESEGRFILNRAHLGETVYAPRYRGYDGSYAMQLEERFPSALETSLLVLLYTSSFRFLSDDGQSFDVTKRNDEQTDFMKAYLDSRIAHKIMIDVHDGHGRFVDPNVILNLVSDVYTGDAPC